MSLRIEVDGSEVRIEGSVVSRHAAEYLARQADRELAFTRAIEIGTFCLERMSTSGEMDFVKREVDGLLARVSEAIGRIPESVERELMDKVGTDKGQVLEPLAKAVAETTKAAESGIADAKKALNQIDPDNASGTVAKALEGVRNLLDPMRKDSVSSRVEDAMKNLVSPDGTFAKAVAALIDQGLKPLSQQIETLSDRLIQEEAVAEVVSRTTEKGLPYELEVVERLRPWAQVVGATVEHVGGDNQAGDVLVRFSQASIAGRELAIVIEVRDRADAKGIKRVTDDLRAAMQQRGAAAGIYLGRTSDAFAKEIGEWADGSTDAGPYVACVDHSLALALRFALALVRIEDMHRASEDIDATALAPLMAKIRVSMGRVRTMKTKVTNIYSAADGIRDEAESLRSEVLEALQEVDGAAGAGRVV